MRCSVIHPKFGRCVVTDSRNHGDAINPHRYDVPLSEKIKTEYVNLLIKAEKGK